MSRRRAKSPPFVMVPLWLVKTLAWQHLDPPARALYLELRQRFNGHNNGMIGLGCREAAKAINVGPDTASRAFRKLSELGFIEATSKGGFSQNGRRATEWLLTELPDSRTGHHAKKPFASWKPALNLNPSPTSRTHSPTSRTQTAKSKAEVGLRPTSRTETAEIVVFASDLKDTSRYTTPPAAELALAGEQASPHKAGARRTRQAGAPTVQLSPSLVANLAKKMQVAT